MNDHIENLKRRAKAMVRDSGLPHQRALDVIARRQGHSDWGSLSRAMNPASRLGDTPTDTPRPALAIRGASIAALTEAVLTAFHGIIVAAEPPAQGDFSPLNTVHVSPDGVSAACGLTHKEGHALEGIGEELGRMSRAAAANGVFFLHMTHGRKGWSPASLELRNANGAYWMSQFIEGEFMHRLWPTGQIMTDASLPDVPASWKAASSWASTHTGSTLDHHFDPIDWGFRPSGLYVIPEGVIALPGVAGCLYEVDDTRPLREAAPRHAARDRMDAEHGPMSAYVFEGPWEEAAAG